MARVEVITGLERRRRWSKEQERAIVAESLVPGAVVSDVARRADIGAGQLYRWGKEFRAAADGFAQVLIAPPEIPAAEVAAGERARSICLRGPVAVGRDPPPAARAAPRSRPHTPVCAILTSRGPWHNIEHFTQIVNHLNESED